MFQQQQQERRQQRTGLIQRIRTRSRLSSTASSVSSTSHSLAQERSEGRKSFGFGGGGSSGGRGLTTAAMREHTNRNHSNGKGGGEFTAQHNPVRARMAVSAYAQEGAIVPLVVMLGQSTSPERATSLLTAICVLLSSATETREAAEREHVSEAVISTLKQHGDYEQLCEVALYLLHILASSSLSAQHTLGSSGACSRVCDALRWFGRSNPRIARSGCAAIASLAAKSAPSKRKLAKNGACELVVSSLEADCCDSETAQHRYLAAIANLAANSDDNQSRLGDAGAPPAVCRVLSDHISRPETCFLALWCLVQLCGGRDGAQLLNQTRIGECGGCEAIVSAGRAHMQRMRLLELVCGLIHKLSQDHNDNQERLVRAGVCTLLAELIAQCAVSGNVELAGDEDHRAYAFPLTTAATVLTVGKESNGASANPVAKDGSNLRASSMCVRACQSIACLAAHTEAQDAFSEEHVAALLVRVLNRRRYLQHPKAAAGIFEALAAIAGTGSDSLRRSQAEGLSRGGAKTIREAIEYYAAQRDLPMCALGMSALIQLCADNADAQHLLHKQGLVQLTSQVLQTNARDGPLAHQACTLLGNLAWSNPIVQTALGNSGTLTLFLRLLRLHARDSLVCARALWGIVQTIAGHDTNTALLTNRFIEPAHADMEGDDTNNQGNSGGSKSKSKKRNKRKEKDRAKNGNGSHGTPPSSHALGPHPHTHTHQPADEESSSNTQAPPPPLLAPRDSVDSNSDEVDRSSISSAGSATTPATLLGGMDSRLSDVSTSTSTTTGGDTAMDSVRRRSLTHTGASSSAATAVVTAVAAAARSATPPRQCMASGPTAEQLANSSGHNNSQQRSPKPAALSMRDHSPAADARNRSKSPISPRGPTRSNSALQVARARYRRPSRIGASFVALERVTNAIRRHMHERSTVAEYGCWLLLLVTADNAEMQQVLSESGGCALITNVLRMYGNISAVAYYALCAVVNLTGTWSYVKRLNQDIFSSCGACEATADALVSHAGNNRSVVYHGCWAVINLCASHPGNRLAMADTKVCHAVVAALKALVRGQDDDDGVDQHRRTGGRRRRGHRNRKGKHRAGRHGHSDARPYNGGHFYASVNNSSLQAQHTPGALSGPRTPNSPPWAGGGRRFPGFGTSSGDTGGSSNTKKKHNNTKNNSNRDRESHSRWLGRGSASGNGHGSGDAGHDGDGGSSTQLRPASARSQHRTQSNSADQDDPDGSVRSSFGGLSGNPSTGSRTGGGTGASENAAGGRGPFSMLRAASQRRKIARAVAEERALYDTNVEEGAIGDDVLLDTERGADGAGRQRSNSVGDTTTSLAHKLAGGLGRRPRSRSNGQNTIAMDALGSADMPPQMLQGVDNNAAATAAAEAAGRGPLLGLRNPFAHGGGSDHGRGGGGSGSGDGATLTTLSAVATLAEVGTLGDDQPIARQLMALRQHRAAVVDEELARQERKRQLDAERFDGERDDGDDDDDANGDDASTVATEDDMAGEGVAVVASGFGGARRVRAASIVQLRETIADDGVQQPSPAPAVEPERDLGQEGDYASPNADELPDTTSAPRLSLSTSMPLQQHQQHLAEQHSALQRQYASTRVLGPSNPPTMRSEAPDTKAGKRPLDTTTRISVPGSAGEGALSGLATSRSSTSPRDDARVVGGMGTSPSEIASLVCWTMQTLASACPENKLILMQAGACEAVARTLQRWMHRPVVCTRAAAAMAALAGQCAPNQRALRFEGAPHVIAAVIGMHRADWKVVVASCAAIVCLTMGSEHNQRVFTAMPELSTTLTSIAEVSRQIEVQQAVQAVQHALSSKQSSSKAVVGLSTSGTQETRAEEGTAASGAHSATNADPLQRLQTQQQQSKQQQQQQEEQQQQQQRQRQQPHSEDPPCSASARSTAAADGKATPATSSVAAQAMDAAATTPVPGNASTTSTSTAPGTNTSTTAEASLATDANSGGDGDPNEGDRNAQEASRRKRREDVMQRFGQNANLFG